MKKNALSILIITLLTLIGHFSYAQNLGGVDQWLKACDTITNEFVYIQQSELVDDCCWSWDGDNFIKLSNCNNVSFDCVADSECLDCQEIEFCFTVTDTNEKINGARVTCRDCEGNVIDRYAEDWQGNRFELSEITVD